MVKVSLFHETLGEEEETTIYAGAQKSDQVRQLDHKMSLKYLFKLYILNFPAFLFETEIFHETPNVSWNFTLDQSFMKFYKPSHGLTRPHLYFLTLTIAIWLLSFNLLFQCDTFFLKSHVINLVHGLKQKYCLTALIPILFLEQDKEYMQRTRGQCRKYSWSQVYYFYPYHCQHSCSITNQLV